MFHIHFGALQLKVEVKKLATDRANLTERGKQTRNEHLKRKRNECRTMRECMIWGRKCAVIWHCSSSRCKFSVGLLCPDLTIWLSKEQCWDIFYYWMCMETASQC